MTSYEDLNLRRTMFRKIHFIKITDFNYINAGDVFCSPLLWFNDFFSEYTCINHCLSTVRYEQIAKDDIVIIGGGGILHYNPWFNFNIAINKILDLCDNVILWGAGFNSGFKDGKLVYIDPLVDFNRFKIYGIRDYQCENYNYTPCVSALNPLLQVAYNAKPKYKVASMLHPLMQTKKLPGIERNLSHFSNITMIMEFIADHEVIVTNSYHAALWSMLANRKVVAPISLKKGSKFNFLEHDPQFVTDWTSEGQLEEAIRLAKNYPTFLSDSITRILAFFDKVKEIVQNLIPFPDKKYEKFYTNSVEVELYFHDIKKL